MTGTVEWPLLLFVVAGVVAGAYWAYRFMRYVDERTDAKIAARLKAERTWTKKKIRQARCSIPQQ